MKKLILLTALLSAATVNGYAYDARAMYSADQLFDSSLQELREAMASAKQSNEELKAQNRELKEQVSELEGAVVDAGGDENVAPEAPMDNPLSDEVLSEKERKLYQSRLENLSFRVERVNAQKQRLEKNIALYAQENEKTKTQIAMVKKEVSDIQLALSATQKPQIAKVDKKSPLLIKQLAAKKEKIGILEKKLAFQKASLKDKIALKEKYVSENAALEGLLFSGREELARLEGGQKLIGSSAKTPGVSLSDEAMARREIGDLKNYRDHLRESVTDLKKASASVKSSQTGDLEKILKTYKEQQALLQKKMEAVEPGSLALARKQALEFQKSRLEDQIALAQKSQGAAGVSLASASDARAKLNASAQHVAELKKQIANARNAFPLQKQYQDLSGQVAVLQQDLQTLKDNPQGDFAKNLQEVKTEIAQLEARRVVLASSVQNIYEKYNMKELPTQDLAAKDAQLKEYFQTLKLENTALQQKLLTLQMRQDKGASSIQ